MVAKITSCTPNPAVHLLYACLPFIFCMHAQVLQKTEPNVLPNGFSIPLPRPCRPFELAPRVRLDPKRQEMLTPLAPGAIATDFLLDRDTNLTF